MSKKDQPLVDFNVYDDTFGEVAGACHVAAYVQPYAVDGYHPDSADASIVIEGWYPPGLDDDSWLGPLELPRRIRRALVKAGWRIGGAL